MKYKFKNFLMIDKEGKSYEEFYSYFVKKVKYKGHIFQEEIFDDMLIALYNMDNDLYKNWFNSFGATEYGFVRKNLDYINKIIISNNYNDFDKLYEIFCRKNSIISRHVSKIRQIENQDVDISTLKDAYNGLIISIDNNKCKVVNDIKEEYTEMYGNITDPVLKCFFYQNLNEISDNVKEFVKGRLKAIDDRMQTNNRNYFISSAYKEKPRVNMKLFLNK